MAINWIKVLGWVGTGMSMASMAIGAVSQKHEINDAAKKAAEEAVKAALNKK